jgi:hypothetical protein
MTQPATAGSSINRDLANVLRFATSLQTVVAHDTTEGTGVAVDLRCYEGAAVVFLIGPSGDTLSETVKMTLSVQDSDDGSTGWADLDETKFYLRQGAALLIDDPAEDDTLVVVGLVPGDGVKRYVRALVTFDGTHTNGTPISATVVEGFGRVNP